MALWLALPQPPNPSQLAIGSAVGALLIPLGFAAVSRCRKLPRRTGRERARLALVAALAGAALGLVLLGILALLALREPALRARFAGRLAEPAWRPVALAFESSILEEVIFRLFAMGGAAWLLGRFLRRPRIPTIAALVLSALLFGLAHLPAWLAATQPSPILVAGVLSINGSAGILLGWVFWRWGLPYAILCHMLGDLVVQGLGPRLLA